MELIGSGVKKPESGLFAPMGRLMLGGSIKVVAREVTGTPSVGMISPTGGKQPLLRSDMTRNRRYESTYQVSIALQMPPIRMDQRKEPFGSLEWLAPVDSLSVPCPRIDNVISRRSEPVEVLAD